MQSETTHNNYVLDKQERITFLSNQLWRILRKNNVRGPRDNFVEPANCEDFIQINAGDNGFYFINQPEEKWQIQNSVGEILWENRIWPKNNEVIGKLLSFLKVETTIEE